jgi:hypothetical protein
MIPADVVGLRCRWCCEITYYDKDFPPPPPLVCRRCGAVLEKEEKDGKTQEAS